MDKFDKKNEYFLEKIIYPGLLNGKYNSKFSAHLRSRGLSSAEYLTGGHGISKLIEKSKKRNFRILEIGFGYGKLILDIVKKYHGYNIEIHGINLEKEPGMKGWEDLAKNSKILNLKLKNHNNIYLHFYDVNKELKFKSNYFDLIVSQATFFYIREKAKLLEEIWRVLKFNGTALLHFDEVFLKIKYPLIFKNTLDTPHFLISGKNKNQPAKNFFHIIKEKGFNIELKENFKNNRKSVNLKIIKNVKKSLKLNLELDNEKSVDLNVKDRKVRAQKNQLIWMGFLSAYKIRSKIL